MTGLIESSQTHCSDWVIALSDVWFQRRCCLAVLAEMKLPTFDGHLNQSNTDWRRWFDAIHTAQEIDSGIQAGSGSTGGVE